MMQRSTTRLGALFMLFAAFLAACLGGCATSDARITNLASPAPLTELGIDAENPFGGVRIEITDAVDHVCITETLLTRAFSTKEDRQSLADRIMLDVERIESTPGLETLRLRVVAIEPLLTEEGVNLTIKLPRCSGIRVRNSAGDAVLVGVSGAIHVETEDGDIDVRTDEPLRWPIALIADTGDVDLRSAGGDEGRIELVSNTGDVVFLSKLEPLQDMNATLRWVRGTLGGGINPITLRSDSGDVRMMVVEDATKYTRGKTGNRRMASPEKYRDDVGG